MKCDELKPLVFSISDLAYVEEPTPQPNFQNPHDHAVFKATEVEEAIDELKTEHHKERHEYIEMVATLRRENAKLKQKLESVQASMYCDVVDANMEIRRLKRALYKACANWADVEVFERTVGIDDPNVEANRWALMRNKCLKKAEEYK